MAGRESAQSRGYAHTLRARADMLEGWNSTQPHPLVCVLSMMLSYGTGRVEELWQKLPGL